MRLSVLLPVFALIVVSSICHQPYAKSPHIVFIVADDLGWNDVGWHNPDMITPSLDKLAKAGVILNSSYVQPVCSPSRNCFMSGYYPFHTGLQYGVIMPPEPKFLPDNFTLLPQKLKGLGYSTHMVGKWHLGFCNWKYTPTYRGFDSFLGYYGGMEDYYTHAFDAGYDFRFNTSVIHPDKDLYSANIFSSRAIEIIQSTDPVNEKLFLYLPFQSVHAPLQVPKKYENMYSNIKDKNRRIYCGMVSALDEAIGNITAALVEKGFMDNILIIFTTDNGGPVNFGSNNLPLRGAKTTLWEGGTKGAAFVYSPTLLEKSGYTNTEMIHAVDWFPTILSVAGGKPELSIDGIDQWDTIKYNHLTKRTEFVYNIDDVLKNAAIRVGDYKLIVGSPGQYNGWYPLPKLNETSKLQNGELTKNVSLRLFNIKDDPTEHFDIAEKNPGVVEKMLHRLQEYKQTLWPAQHPPYDPKSNPKNFGGNWSPGWC